MNMQRRADPEAPSRAAVRRILFASFVGTTIEFFDFYIFATAAVLVFPTLFFPERDPASAMLQSLATFALAFFARPIGSALFGHFGDRIGRKATLVTALLTMGGSTVLIGVLPPYASIGVMAPVLLALCRFGQGLGLGGEWGGAVLLAIENAPPGKAAWYGSFPQLGAPIGFLCSTGVFLLISTRLDGAELLSFGWRVPFLASAILVLLGLYVRVQLVETPQFRRSLAQGERVRVPFLTVLAQHPRELAVGRPGCDHHVRGLLSHDGVHSELGDHGARIRARRLPNLADVRCAVLCADHPDFRAPRGPHRRSHDL